jgi:hypothetical protein
MIKDYLHIRNLSIVMLGDFNPVIIQPFWLLEKKFIRELEAIDASLEIIHNEISKFDLKWVTIEVTKERCQFRTSMESHFELVRDLAINIFEVLKETPLKSLGINHEFHLALPHDEQYYNFGNNLVPLKNWDGFLNDPKLLNLEIVEANRKDGLNGLLRIKIQPSDQDLPSKNKIMIAINDHFTIDKNKGETGRKSEMINILKSEWRASFERVDSIIEEIWNKVK